MQLLRCTHRSDTVAAWQTRPGSTSAPNPRYGPSASTTPTADGNPKATTATPPRRPNVSIGSTAAAMNDATETDGHEALLAKAREDHRTPTSQKRRAQRIQPSPSAAS